MTGTELLNRAIILDILHEKGLIKQETISDTLDQLIEQDRQQAQEIELQTLQLAEPAAAS